jgi:phospholipid/cholesterol/gamma-HCH transport system permease protein
MLTTLGRNALSLLKYLGELAFLAYETCASIFSAPIRWRLLLRQVVEVGWRSQPVVVVTGAFTGAVLTAQTFFQFNRLGMKSAVGSVVAVAMFRELGPVLTGLMVSGRVGASIAAEIGTMKVTEQIDALRALGVHPIDYLVVPRVVAMMISMPLLVAEACAISIAASRYVSSQVLGVTGPYDWANTIHYVGPRDLKMALTKGVVFAVLIVFIACHQGLNTKNGAVGVGRAPTEAVVLGSLAILIINFFLTFALNIVFPAGLY